MASIARVHSVYLPPIFQFPLYVTWFFMFLAPTKARMDDPVGPPSLNPLLRDAALSSSN